MKQDNLNLLANPKVIQWCYEGITKISLKNTGDEKKLKKPNEIEKAWGNKVIRTKGGGQWTTQLCQGIVMEALIKLGRKNVSRTTSKKSSVRDKYYNPDLECDDFVYEVKGRNWTTTGTAGEKILGVPLKYGELPKLYKKPLQIILVGYQEYEARKGFAFGDLLDENNQTKELQDSLAFYKDHRIESPLRPFPAALLRYHPDRLSASEGVEGSVKVTDFSTRSQMHSNSLEMDAVDTPQLCCGEDSLYCFYRHFEKNWDRRELLD